MTIGDFETVDGVECINLTVFDSVSGLRNTEKRLKTIASERRIPIHPELISAGLLDFVAEARKGGGERLFPALRANPAGPLLHWFSMGSVTALGTGVA